jgi:hypothetical protein
MVLGLITVVLVLGNHLQGVKGANPFRNATGMVECTAIDL